MSSIEKAVLANATAQVSPSTFCSPEGRLVGIQIPYSVIQMGRAGRLLGRFAMSLSKSAAASKGIAKTKGSVSGVGFAIWL